MDILSGTHGTATGRMDPEYEFFRQDVERFGDLKGVTVHNISEMTDREISDILVDRPGTIIGGFCDSGSCLVKYLD